jgi:hypothetical protein
MIPMDADWLAELADAVGEHTNPAAPELVLATALAAAGARPVGHPAASAERLARELPPVLRRLLDAETALATLRHVIADLVAEIDEGDELHTDDVRHRLAAAGMRLDDEIETAHALRAARVAAAAL